MLPTADAHRPWLGALVHCGFWIKVCVRALFRVLASDCSVCAEGARAPRRARVRQRLVVVGQAALVVAAIGRHGGAIYWSSCACLILPPGARVVHTISVRVFFGVVIGELGMPLSPAALLMGSCPTQAPEVPSGGSEAAQAFLRLVALMFPATGWPSTFPYRCWFGLMVRFPGWVRMCTCMRRVWVQHGSYGVYLLTCLWV